MHFEIVTKNKTYTMPSWYCWLNIILWTYIGIHWLIEDIGTLIFNFIK